MKTVLIPHNDFTGSSDTTTESAIAKLMFLLGCGKPKDEIRQLLQVSLRGEMTD